MNRVKLFSRDFQPNVIVQQIATKLQKIGLLPILRVLLTTMGVDHGVRGGQVPQNLERGIVPPDFVMFQNFKHQITCSTK